MLASPPPERVVHPTWIEQTPKEDISISTKGDISISRLHTSGKPRLWNPTVLRILQVRIEKKHLQRRIP